jgi:hypothetical protein
MPERDPFDDRLAQAVHAFADRARTSVDAVAVAEQAIGPRRAGPLAMLGRAVPVPVGLLVIPLVLAWLLGWSLTGGGPFPIRPWTAPLATPTVAPTPTAAPTPTIAPDAPAHATGTASTTRRAAGTTTLDDNGLAHTSGVVLEVVATMDDPRIAGTGTYRVNVDADGALGFASGTLRLVAADGSWSGTCSGSTWDGLDAGNLSCWLAGDGPYAGMTLHLNHRFGGGSAPDDVSGTVYPGEPPSP